jgi:hypothetical protein
MSAITAENAPMKIILDRNSATNTWFAEIYGQLEVFNIGKHADARDAVIAVQRGNPEAEVGVKSTVFGPATVATFGPVVWMQPNLSP